MACFNCPVWVCVNPQSWNNIKNSSRSSINPVLYYSPWPDTHLAMPLRNDTEPKLGRRTHLSGEDRFLWRGEERVTPHTKSTGQKPTAWKGRRNQSCCSNELDLQPWPSVMPFCVVFIMNSTSYTPDNFHRNSEGSVNSCRIELEAWDSLSPLWFPT